MSSSGKSVSEIVDEIGMGRYQVGLLFLLGLFLTGDSMEILLLAVIGPMLKCQWFLTEYEVALITTIVFIGIMAGSALFGYLSDVFGRRSVIILSGFICVYFGCLTAASPGYIWILILRCCVGMGIGGMVSSVTILLAEVTPTKWRNKGLTAMESLWTIGSIIESLLAYFVGTTLGWHWLIALSVLPLFIATVLTFLLPESPQYLLLEGEFNKVKEILQTIAKTNKKSIAIDDNIRVPEVQDQKGNFKMLFHKNYYLLTILILIISFVDGFIYYGTILLTSTLPQTPYKCLQDMNQWSTKQKSIDTSCCVKLSDHTLIGLIITSTGELLAFPIIAILGDTLGRKWTLGISFGVIGVSYILLNLCMPNVAQTILFMINRVFCLTAFVTTWTYTLEVYPTPIRSFSVGVSNAASRLGGLVTPFVAQVMLTDSSVLGALIVYSLAAILALIATVLLPIETKGLLLKSSVNDVEEEQESVKEKLKSFDKDKKKYDTFEESSFN